VQRVTRSILAEFLKTPPDNYDVKLVYATLGNRGYRYANKFLAKLDGKDSQGAVDDVVEAFSGDIFLGLDLQHHTTRFQSETLKAMRRNGVFVCFVVYDLLPIQFPHFWPGEHGVKLVHENWLKVVCEADAAIGISKAVADELKMWIARDSIPHANHFKASWFHLGANISNSPTQGMPANADVMISQLKERPSFLLVGTLEPRKGYQQVLDSFELLWSQGQQVNLVIVGKKGWLVDELHQRIISHSEAGKRFFWIDSASDRFLEKLYEACTCLIAASYGEGFGLPLIEAAQHQTPIIARNLPVFKEVADDAAYYFDGLLPSDLADAVLAWLALYREGRHPKSSQLKWQNWEESAKQLWDVVLRLKSDTSPSPAKQVTNFE
jgi:glycosyltransferase involved in cell wall biosynthesis